MSLLPTPAYAGHWVWTLSGSSGQASVNGVVQSTYTAPTGPVTLTPIMIPGVSASGAFSGPQPIGTPQPIKATATLKIIFKGTWTSDTNSDNTAPTSVLFGVSSSATGNCSTNGGPIIAGLADDGFHDPFDPKAQSPGTSDTPPRKYQPSDAGSISLTLTLSASATGAPGTHGGGSANATVGPFTIAIHAQPYDWHITNVADNGNGSIEYYYNWSSTSGSKIDLTSCFIHEWVTYPGVVGSAVLPLSYTMPPPFSGSLFNPTVAPGTGPNGQPATDPIGYDNQGMPALSLISPHITGGFTGTQMYEFDDTLTGQTNVLIPGPDSGPLSIVRSVYTSGGILWYYTLTKSGYTITVSI